VFRTENPAGDLRVAVTGGLTRPTVTAAPKRLSGLGITREITGRARDRRFVYGQQLAELDQGIGDQRASGQLQASGCR